MKCFSSAVEHGEIAKVLGGRALGLQPQRDIASVGGHRQRIKVVDALRDNGLLGEHAILRGRDSSEAVKNIKSFTGQSLGLPLGRRF